MNDFNNIKPEFPPNNLYKEGQDEPVCDNNNFYKSFERVLLIILTIGSISWIGFIIYATVHFVWKYW